MASLRVLVTGKQGQLVRSLLEVGPARGIEIVAVGRPELELTDPRSVSAVIAAQRPAVLVHAAGYTDTEHAEVEPELAHAINVDGAAAVAAAARALAVPMIHLSSAYVFDGTSGAAYREDAGLHPLGVYGRTKALGEAAVVAAQPDHVILRASMVFSPFGRNTLTNLLKRTEQRDALEVVADQRLNPTSALDLAGAIVTIAANLAGAPSDVRSTASFTWRAAASRARRNSPSAVRHSSRHGGPTARVIRVSSEKYPSRVRRPLNALLDCTRIAAVTASRCPRGKSRCAIASSGCSRGRDGLRRTRQRPDRERHRDRRDRPAERKQGEPVTGKREHGQIVDHPGIVRDAFGGARRRKIHPARQLGRAAREVQYVHQRHDRQERERIEHQQARGTLNQASRISSQIP